LQDNLKYNEKMKIQRKVITALFCLTGIYSAVSQEADPAWGIKFSGFIKTDVFYDTRQSGSTGSIREGHFFLFPDNVLYDSAMNDLNANPSFHIISIQTRLKGDITGPDAFGAKTSGTIEAEFFGTSESDLNGFRLRHAFVKMDWAKTSLLIGQYWHPLFPFESFPGTLSFNTGAPFVPFSRNPQVRLTRKLGEISISLSAYSQRDFTSSGPDGNSSKYMRNSGLPGFNLLLRVPAGDVVTGWAGVDYKQLRPELRTAAYIETDARVGSLSLFANLKMKTKPVNISVMGFYGQNASDLVMIGGYAVSEITDTVSRFKEYTNLNTASFWTDLTTNGKTVVFGIFAGYSKNLGTTDQIAGTVYGRGNNIDHLFRLSPRVIVTKGRLSLGAEVESTTAAYGNIGTDGRVTDTNNVNNLRILLSAVYKF
jgi:hypothetical protein